MLEIDMPVNGRPLPRVTPAASLNSLGARLFSEVTGCGVTVLRSLKVTSAVRVNPTFASLSSAMPAAPIETVRKARGMGLGGSSTPKWTASTAHFKGLLARSTCKARAGLTCSLSRPTAPLGPSMKAFAISWRLVPPSFTSQAAIYLAPEPASRSRVPNGFRFAPCLSGNALLGG